MHDMGPMGEQTWLKHPTYKEKLLATSFPTLKIYGLKNLLNISVDILIRNGSKPTNGCKTR